MTATRAASSRLTQSVIVLNDNALALQVCGEQSAYLKSIEKAFDVSITARGNELTIVGAPVDVQLSDKTIRGLYELVEDGRILAKRDVEHAIQLVKEDKDADLLKTFNEKALVVSGKRFIAPKTLNQTQYIEAIHENDIVFGIGPAGTGKTYLAMAMAVSALLKDRVKRIILTRPAVEAGEKLGFLPGDLAEKVNPYLRPLYDALYDMLPFERVLSLIEKRVIEVAPLAFMRGRTLNDAFIILDEAQNTTTEQMKMFLTRLGYNSKAVITGDVTQIDLPERQVSGLVEARNILQGIGGIAFIFFSKQDVVRHRLVSRIIQAYEDAEKQRKEKFTSPPNEQTV
ncbi:MAG: PhoH family protein [Dissulfuribacterales bacterium]